MSKKCRELERRLVEPEPEPGEPIVKVTCPCCGAELEIAHGDDAGEIGVIGTARRHGAEQ